MISDWKGDEEVGMGVGRVGGRTWMPQVFWAVQMRWPKAGTEGHALPRLLLNCSDRNREKTCQSVLSGNAARSECAVTHKAEDDGSNTGQADDA